MLATELNWAEPNQNEQRSEDQSGAEQSMVVFFQFGVYSIRFTLLSLAYKSSIRISVFIVSVSLSYRRA